MPVVITPEELLNSKNTLHFNGFFVDTNIVILNQDPFGESTRPEKTFLFESVQEAVQNLKSDGLIPYSTIPVILEYYKFIQYNSFTLYLNKKRFSTKDFKEAKKNNPRFAEKWETQMKPFKRVFNKTFPLFEIDLKYNNLVDKYNFEEIDFGDHLLINVVTQAKSELKMIFSNDMDFYTLSDEYFLITTNNKILTQAKIDKKHFKQLFT